MRSNSPTAAIDIPTAIDRGVGRASTSVAAPHRNPSATRLRASASVVALRALADRSARRLDTAGHIRETAADRVDDLPRLDVEQTHPIELAAAQMMALAHRVPR